MSSMAIRLAKFFRTSTLSSPTISSGMVRIMRSSFSTGSFGGEHDDESKIGDGGEESFDDLLGLKPALDLQSVDPQRGKTYRGVHKAILCGKVGQNPVQKILRSGRTITIFTVGTGGMFDQRTLGDKDSPKPAQWHRIVVHNEALGAYVVQQLAKNSSVYVEGDIETRVYNDSINGQVKNIPEICVHRDGRVCLVKGGERMSEISFDDLREVLFS